MLVIDRNDTEPVASSLPLQVQEEYVLVIDADMVMRRPILPQVLSDSSACSIYHVSLCAVSAIGQCRAGTHPAAA